MFVVKHYKKFLWATIALIVLSVGAFISLRGQYSIEFTGGSTLAISFDGNVPERAQIETLARENFGDNFRLRQEGEGYRIETAEITGEQKEAFLTDIRNSGGENQIVVQEEEFLTFGPSLSKELARNSLYALGAALVLTVIFVTIAFSRVSRPIPSWMYGIVAIITLLHDIIIPTGVYAILSRYTSFQIDVLFVTALLAILGYSINDTLIIFDRIRETLQRNSERAHMERGDVLPQKKERYETLEPGIDMPERKEQLLTEPFEVTVGKSLSQVAVRSVVTSLTTTVVLLVLLVVGGDATRSFSLVLFIGMVAGTYSSIFFASPLLIAIAKWRAKDIQVQ